MGMLLLGVAALALLLIVLQGNRGLDAQSVGKIVNTSLIVALGGIAVVLFLRGLYGVGLAVTLVAVALNFIWNRKPRTIAPPPPRMTRAEALDVLGLVEGVGADDIRAAYNRLIKQMHPDHGGTNYLAAKLNQARDVLLG